MYQYCPTCGSLMTFYYQNQSWYCHRCQRYAGQPYNASPALAFIQQPAALPDEAAARSKIYGAMRMREHTDKVISTSWALAILAFQVLVPVVSLIVIYIWALNSNFNLSVIANLLVILAVFVAAIAMVIFYMVLVYKLVKRRDEHFRRDGLLRQGMMEFLDAAAIREQKDINVERWTMNSMNFSVSESDRGPGLWALLTGLIAIIPVIGIFALVYSLHFLTKDVHEHERRQRDFSHQFQLGMLKLGRINAKTYDWHPLPRRDTAAYVLLTIFTLGFALPYWWYVNIVDMNMHLQNQWQFESQVLRMIREEQATQAGQVMKDEVNA